MPKFSDLINNINNASNRFANGLENGAGYLGSPRTATSAFNLDGTELHENVPRTKFEYFVKINLNTDPAILNYMKAYGFDSNNQNLDKMQSVIKSVTMPSFSMETDTLDRYNRKIVSYRNIRFGNVDMTFHDVADSKVLRFWQAYYGYYYKDGISVEKLDLDEAQRLPDKELFDETKVNNRFGYNLEDVQNVRNLIESIEIFQVHNKKYTKAVLVHPKVVDFTHDTLDYEATSELVELRFSFQPESVIYETDGILTSENIGKFLPAPGLYLDIPSIYGSDSVSKDQDSNDLTRKEDGTFKVATIDDSSNEFDLGFRPGGAPGSLDTGDTSALDSLLNNVEGSLSDLVDSAPADLLNNAADALTRGAVTGNFDISPSPGDTLKSLGKNTAGKFTQQSVRDFKASVSDSIKNSVRNSNGQGGVNNE